MSATKASIQGLFDNVSSPTQLVQPSGGVSMDIAINNANNLLNQLRASGSNAPEIGQLGQLLAFAKGLQMLTPYFTDLTMTTPNANGRTAADLSTTNSSIANLGIENQSYRQKLNDLMALLGQDSTSK